MYKYRNRDEGSYQSDPGNGFATGSPTEGNGAVVKDKVVTGTATAAVAKAATKGKKNKDKEYYV
jgi:hypothetical protein